MKICKDGLCPINNLAKCCAFCEDKENCNESCEYSNDLNCINSLEQEMGVTEFKDKQLSLIKAISEIETQKALLAKRSEDMRTSLLAAMEQYQVKSFENDLIKVAYIAPTTRNSIDSAKLKKEMPEVAAKYNKVSNVKASVKITVK